MPNPFTPTTKIEPPNQVKKITPFKGTLDLGAAAVDDAAASVEGVRDIALLSLCIYVCIYKYVLAPMCMYCYFHPIPPFPSHPSSSIHPSTTTHRCSRR